MKTLTSNAGLYGYLVTLEGNLREHGLPDLGDKLVVACKQAAATSTEFLGEARMR